MSGAESKSPTLCTLMIKGAAVALLSAFLSMVLCQWSVGRCGGSGVSVKGSLLNRHGVSRTRPTSRGALRFAETARALAAFVGLHSPDFFRRRSRPPLRGTGTERVCL